MYEKKAFLSKSVCASFKWFIIAAFHMQTVDPWLCVLIILWILNSLVQSRTNWTNSIDGFYSTNANWIRRHCSVVHHIYCTSMGYSRCDNLYARNKVFDREIRCHRTGTGAFVCHDDHSIRRPIEAPSPMCRSMWSHRLMSLPPLLMDFVTLSRCKCLKK